VPLNWACENNRVNESKRSNPHPDRSKCLTDHRANCLYSVGNMDWVIIIERVTCRPRRSKFEPAEPVENARSDKNGLTGFLAVAWDCTASTERDYGQDMITIGGSAVESKASCTHLPSFIYSERVEVYVIENEMVCVSNDGESFTMAETN
jgi:hypothetical protein